VDAGLYEPCKEAFRQAVREGTETERIDSPSVARHMCETYPERCAALQERDNLTILVHDDLPPYGLTLVDDRVAVSGYDPERGSVTAVVDTDAPAARAWGESVYASYRADARPFDAAAVVG
jgi:predicted transcriptional regulator